MENKDDLVVGCRKSENTKGLINWVTSSEFSFEDPGWYCNASGKDNGIFDQDIVQ